MCGVLKLNFDTTTQLSIVYPKPFPIRTGDRFFVDQKIMTSISSTYCLKKVVEHNAVGNPRLPVKTF